MNEWKVAWKKQKGDNELVRNRNRDRESRFSWTSDEEIMEFKFRRGVVNVIRDETYVYVFITYVLWINAQNLNRSRANEEREVLIHCYKYKQRRIYLNI